VAVEGRKLAYAAHYTSYKAVARSRWQSLGKNDVTQPLVIESDVI